MSTSASEAVSARKVASTIAIIPVVALVIAGLAVLDIALARTEEAETEASAREAYRNGRALLAQHKTDEAVEAFRKAHASVRDNTTYQLALINGLMAAGKAGEAEPLMDEVLQSAPNDGPSVLLAARLMASKGKPIAAAALYHRAIYGEWPKDARQQQIAARLELIQFFERLGRQQDMLAELIPLEDEAGSNETLRLKIANLFLAANAPGHAETAFRSLIQRDPTDALAYEGLGKVELETGDYRRAHSAFTMASVRNGNLPDLAAQLSLTKSLTELDPTSRHLSSGEKYQRSLKILQMTRDDFQSCIASSTRVNADESSTLTEQADDLLTAKAAVQPTNELAESILDVAQRLWQVRKKVCASPAKDELRLIMEKLSQ